MGGKFDANRAAAHLQYLFAGRLLGPRPAGKQQAKGQGGNKGAAKIHDWGSIAPSDQPALQPPLPLQLFLPLQPMSPVEQPPLPLQLLRPLQSCLSEAALAADVPESLFELEQPVETTVPASNPAMAAETTKVLTVLDI
jgi:hypothetical protein